MNTPEDIAAARASLLTAMRVRGNQTPYPPEIKSTAPEILKRVDTVTLQKIWTELLAEASKTQREPQSLCDMSADGLEELMREIKSQGIDEKTAWHYAALIGNTPIMDEAHTCIIVRDGTKEVARLKPLKHFDMD